MKIQICLILLSRRQNANPDFCIASTYVWTYFSKFKVWFDASLSQEESKIALLHSLIRSEIEEYNSKTEGERSEVIVCDELGYRNIEGFGDIFIVGKGDRSYIWEFNPINETI